MTRGRHTEPSAVNPSCQIGRRRLATAILIRETIVREYAPRCSPSSPASGRKLDLARFDLLPTSFTEGRVTVMVGHTLQLAQWDIAKPFAF